jgi:hypothetical protein
MSAATMNIEEITPELAESYLSKNLHNRNLRQRTVDAYALDMQAGDWDFTGESIKFATDGTLIDGQHRLAAIIQSGVTVRMGVVTGLALIVQENVDNGVRRTFGDVLKLRGESNYASLASIVRGVYQWENNQRRSFGRGATTHSQLSATLEKYPWLRDGVTVARGCADHAGLPGFIGGTLWFAFSQIDSDDADYFFEHLRTGENLGSSHPILALRRALAAATEVRGKRNPIWMLAITCKAWNKFRAGEEVVSLTWRAGGSSPERFPEPE